MACIFSFQHFKLCLSDAGQCTLSYPERMYMRHVYVLVLSSIKFCVQLFLLVLTLLTLRNVVDYLDMPACIMLTNLWQSASDT